MLMGKPWWASLWFIWAVACKGVIRVSVSGETDSPTAQHIDNPESEAARLPGPCSDRQSGRYQGSGLSGCCRAAASTHLRTLFALVSQGAYQRPPLLRLRGG